MRTVAQFQAPFTSLRLSLSLDILAFPFPSLKAGQGLSPWEFINCKDIDTVAKLSLIPLPHVGCLPNGPTNAPPPLVTIHLKIWDPSIRSQNSVPGPLHTFGWYIDPPTHTYIHTHLQCCQGPGSDLLEIKLSCSAHWRESISQGVPPLSAAPPPSLPP